MDRRRVNVLRVNPFSAEPEYWSTVLRANGLRGDGQRENELVSDRKWFRPKGKPKGPPKPKVKIVCFLKKKSLKKVKKTATNCGIPQIS
jgi:hypothetical protein